ncbi:MAG TPA: YggS family pyridoxal phosphate-dependent enzyme [Phycisphaerales bacterium]|nr:YggS family pyridoxal phosphate-dependent enzyme [Phycisphaerales bacterium]
MQGRGTAMSATLAERYHDVCERIAAAARRSGRRAEDVILVAVTKNAEPEQIRGLLELGHRDLGENRVQQLIQHAGMVEEFLERVRVHPKGHQDRAARDAAAAGLLRPDAPLPDGVRWHMIGHLQRNKARKVVELCRLIHSVDSLRLAEEVQQIALRTEKPVEVLVQVNCSLEPQKFGCPIAAARPLTEQIDTMINVRVRGLMTMAALGDNQDQARSAFSRCRELFEEIRRKDLGDGRFNILSMGMTADFETAIEEGANVIRVGTAIFGEAKPEVESTPPE